MEIIGGVTAVPFGLLACRIDGREVQITEIGENGFAFRTAEPIAMEKNEDHRIEVSFYHMVQGQYETVRIRGIQRSPVITLEREERWYRVYSVDVQQEDYRREVRELVLWYDRYIQLKCTCDDGELAGHLTGYPAELDEVYGKSFEEQKENWFGAVVTDSSNMTDRVGFADCALPAAEICGREVMAVVEGMELALELDGPKWYDCYLKEKLSEVSRQYWETGGLENIHWRNGYRTEFILVISFAHVCFQRMNSYSGCWKKQSGMDFLLPWCFPTWQKVRWGK